MNIKEIAEKFEGKKYYPFNSNNEIRVKFIGSTDLYIMVRCNDTYKGFIFNEENPDGKKYCQGKNEGDLLSKIPHYWG